MMPRFNEPKPKKLEIKSRVSPKFKARYLRIMDKKGFTKESEFLRIIVTEYMDKEEAPN